LARWMMLIIAVFGLYLVLTPTSFGIRFSTDSAVCGGIFMFAAPRAVSAGTGSVVGCRTQPWATCAVGGRGRAPARPAGGSDELLVNFGR
jgi:hypothetical protein